VLLFQAGFIDRALSGVSIIFGCGLIGVAGGNHG
jgi:hypothetical protein